MQELHVKSLLPVRLDKYLMEQFPALGLGRLNKALRENKIKLNGKKQPLATRVQNGDVIRVYLLDDQLGLTSQEGPEFLQARAPAEFIYENDDLIVANKPAGIPVDGDEADTLLNRVLRRLYEEKRWDAAHEPRLCHRKPRHGAAQCGNAAGDADRCVPHRDGERFLAGSAAVYGGCLNG